jgi:hypothetical protein
MAKTGTLSPKQVVHFQAKRVVHFARNNQLEEKMKEV